MEETQLAALLEAIGCPSAKSQEMARQLIKRSRQMMKAKGCSEAEALQHLISLMRLGWAAKSSGL